MKRYNYADLSATDIDKLVQRNADKGNEVRGIVESVIEEVKANGDSALLDYALRFDKVGLNKLYLDKAELAEIAAGITDEQDAALQTAYNNIYKFHAAQLKEEEKVETMPGVTCWRSNRAIESVGLYIPGGTAVLPSTLLMLGIPARIAGCSRVTVCSPPQKNGKVNAFVARVAMMLDIDKIYLAGGAQAVAAMAYGTGTIARVNKIFGPGNQFVTMAKTIIQSTTTTAIDMPAGPSEVLIIADESAVPAYVAADLLAQAEHGTDSQAVLVCTSALVAESVLKAIEEQVPVLPRAGIIEKALENSYIVVADNLTDAIDFSNAYAPEHLILATGKWHSLIEKIVNAGSVFLGNLTPESAGDYASGTNHTLPTGAFARAYSGVSVDSFIKKITFQHITPQGLLNIGPTIQVLAELEGLQAHKKAVSVRM